MSPASGQRKRDEMLKTSCQPLDLSEILTHEGSHLNISVTDQQFPFDVGNFSWELQLSIITIRTLLNGISHPPKSSHLELTRSPHLEEGSSLGILKRNNLVLRRSRVLESAERTDVRIRPWRCRQKLELRCHKQGTPVTPETRRATEGWIL